MCEHSSVDVQLVPVMTSVERVEEGWKLSGRVHCPACFDAIALLQKHIPIETSAFHCPSCNEIETLEYILQKIAEGSAGFEFEVRIQCNRCSKKRSLKKLLKSLFEML